MKRKVLILFSCLITTSLFAQVSDDFYVIDAKHSILSFKARHIGFGSVIGKFDVYEGTIYFDPNDISATSASMVASANSINSGAASRDGILQREFFQVEQYPFVTFNSTRTRKEGDQYYLIGNLKLGGVTKEVEIPFKHISGPSTDQFKHSRITLGGEISLNRKDFGLFYRSNNFWDGIVADEVKIEIESGAYVYNSLETVFPFRENAIGRLAFEAYEDGGNGAMEKKLDEVLADPKKYDTGFSSMVRGADHLDQNGKTAAAVELLEMCIAKAEIEDEWMSEFLSRKAKFNLKLGKNKLANKDAEAAMELYPNALAMEVLKKSQ